MLSNGVLPVSTRKTPPIRNSRLGSWPARALFLSLSLMICTTWRTAIALAEGQQVYDSNGWNAECEVDAMTDHKVCTIKLNTFDLNSTTKSFASLLLFEDGSVSIVVPSGTVLCSIRVEKNEALTTTAQPFCDFDKASAKKIQKQLLTASKILLSYSGYGGILEPTEFSAKEFRDAVSATKEWKKTQ